MSFNVQARPYRCQTCYVVRGVGTPRLQECSQCKAVYYCSKECQKADWKRHKTTCKGNAEDEKDLEADDIMVATFGRLPAELIPANLSLSKLDELLADWVRAHKRTLTLAFLHAIRFPDAYDRIHTHFLVLQLRPLRHAVPRGDPARAFEIADALPLSVAQGAHIDDRWRQGLAQLRTMQTHAEEIGAGRMGAMAIECPGLSVQWVPVEGLHPVRGIVQEDWKEILIEDVREGSTRTRLTTFPLF